MLPLVRAGFYRNRRSDKAETKRKGGIVYESRDSSTFMAFLGAITGGVTGLAKDLDKTYFKYQFGLKDVDSGNETIFYSDTLVQVGDCVYVDVGSNKGQRDVKIKKVEDHVCSQGS